MTTVPPINIDPMTFKVKMIYFHPEILALTTILSSKDQSDLPIELLYVLHRLIGAQQRLLLKDLINSPA